MNNSVYSKATKSEVLNVSRLYSNIVAGSMTNYISEGLPRTGIYLR